MSRLQDEIDAAVRQREAKEKAELDRLAAVAAMKATLPYSREMAAEICDRIADGDVLKDICALEHTPALKLARAWLKDRPEFADSYRAACAERLFAWEDEMIVTARDNSGDFTQKDTAQGYVPVPNSAAVSRSKLQVETLARRLRAEWPDKYGDSVTLKQPAQPSRELTEIPLGELERMAETARQFERDDDMRAMLRQADELKARNKERRKRGEPPLTLREHLSNGEPMSNREPIAQQ